MSLSERLFHAAEKNMGKHALYKALEEKSGIAAYSWNNASRGKQRPTAEMIEWVCQAWPEFAFWITTGTLPNEDFRHESAVKTVTLEKLDASVLAKEPINWSEEEVASLTNEVLGRIPNCRFPHEVLFLISDARSKATRLKNWIKEKRRDYEIKINTASKEEKRSFEIDSSKFEEAVEILKGYGAAVS